MICLHPRSGEFICTCTDCNILQNIDANDITYIFYKELAFQDHILLHFESLNSSNSTPHCLTKQSTHWKMDQKLLLLMNYICPDVSWMHAVPFHALNYAPEKISITFQSNFYSLNFRQQKHFQNHRKCTLFCMFEPPRRLTVIPQKRRKAAKEFIFRFHVNLQNKQL